VTVPAVPVSSVARGQRHRFTLADALRGIPGIGILTALLLSAAQAAPSDAVKPGGPGGTGSGVTQGRVTVCTWRGNKKAAYTFTIDDGVPQPTPIMARIFNENHVKATWYPVVKDWTDWQMWAELVKAGHEVGSHTRTHPVLKNLTDAQKTDEIVGSKTIMERELRKYVPDYQCLTFAFPGGFADADEASLEIARKNYIAAKRGWGINPASPELNGYKSQGPRTATPLAQYNGWVDEALETGGWQTETYHGIQGVGGWEATPLNIFEKHVQYAASKSDELWIDTVAEIARYIRERDSSLVEIVMDSGEELVVDLTDTMDDAVFGVPLTIRILTRPGWKSPLTVTQKGRTTRVNLVEEAGQTCTYVEAVPDQGPIVIRPAGE
jgi:peptidoglycan/xylan/chitin deacetylase (PgdA/CDA1 family)